MCDGKLTGALCTLNVSDHTLSLVRYRTVTYVIRLSAFSTAPLIMHHKGMVPTTHSPILAMNTSLKSNTWIVRIQVHTMASVDMTAFWVIGPRILVDVNRRLRVLAASIIRAMRHFIIKLS
jgi:hypothetical protein